MIYLIIFYCFVLGLIFGSFLNAFEYRLFTNQDWIKSRSHCPNCKHTLGISDLFPVVSWIFLRGKCRYCKSKISFQYPLIEFITGISFSTYTYLFLNHFEDLFFLSWIDWMTFLIGLVSIWFLIFFSIYDLKYGIIPNKVVIPLIVIVLLTNVIIYVLSFFNISIINDFDFLNKIIAGIIAGGFFFLIIFFTKGKGMGGGDMKLAFLFGIFFGGLPTLIILYIAFIIGGFYASVVLLLKKKSFGQTLPFGPFLCLGTLLFLFLGEKIIDFVSDNFFLFSLL